MYIKEDEIQEAIITSPANHILVSAVPGSGKTHVLTQRAKYLCNKGYSVLALVFNNKAADEIKSRLKHKNFQAATIHSYFYRLLGCPELEFKEIESSFVNLLRNVHPLETRENDFTGILEKFINKNHKPEFDFMLVDEFQDINNLQWTVVNRMAEQCKGYLVVGDFQQCIYQYNGANNKIFKEILDNDTRFTLFSLNRNYRSGSSIIGLVNNVFGTNILPGRNYLGNVINYKGDYSYLPVIKDLVYLCRFKKEVGQLISRGAEAYTIHSCKGLEFKNVFCTFPEFVPERNLLYVAWTRAKNNLVLHNYFSEYKNIKVCNTKQELEFKLAL